jgi:hypothetical protein
MGVKYSCYNKCHIISIFNPIGSLWPYISSCGVYIRPALKTLRVMVPRAALGVRVPRAHARRVATPSDRIDLNQGVRVPWPVPITRLIIFTMNESMGMKVTFGSTSTPQIQ